MKIQFYGVRGSYPVPGESTLRYGGNTTCVSISKEIDGKIYRVIIDSGTGIIKLGKEIIGNFFAGKENLNIPILFTHLHPDHTQGFPFFAPDFSTYAVLNLYGMKALEIDLEDILSAQMVPPNFPIEYRSLKSIRVHKEISDGPVDTSVYNRPGFGKQRNSPFSVLAMQAFAPSHPQQGAIYYKIKDLETDKTVVCVWDNESKIGGDQAVINFAKDCDLLIHDTQYTTEEYTSNKMIVQGFGHSTYEMAIETAIQAKANRLVCTHFNPSHTDRDLDRIQKSLPPFAIMAQEGLTVEL